MAALVPCSAAHHLDDQTCLGLGVLPFPHVHLCLVDRPDFPTLPPPDDDTNFPVSCPAHYLPNRPVQLFPELVGQIRFAPSGAGGFVFMLLL